MSSGSSLTPMPEFRPAVKESRPVRLAFEGPSGSGRTLTALLVAAALGEPIALIDTERGMAAKYADRVPFHTQEFTNYDPTSLFSALARAAVRDYPVLVVDTYSAFWSGAGGMLDKVDGEARAGYGGTNAGWSKHRPMERAVTEALAAYPGHIVVTLRARTDTVIETDTRGRQYARRISVRPEQRADIEYDFDAVGTLGPVATVYFGKSRIPALAGEVIDQPGEDLGRTILAWANDGVPNWPQRSFIERARDPDATVDSLRELWPEIVSARAAGMAALDLHDQPTTLADLVTNRGKQLRAFGPAAPQPASPPSAV
ncbi:AAA family ATPase [Streptomyces tauricus]|uniref:AAA family ATPase n=1 Tax=Streptomyces tauricus TaxID=68274 RepID=UPI0022446EE3|nr:AAA family ATPase [Streptomyces tauricus]MCW8101640.1 ATP-binding protein [Streptomyces tauricus]